MCFHRRIVLFGACGLVAWVTTAVDLRGQAAATREIWRVAGSAHGQPALGESTAYFLSERHEIIAIDAASGSVKWRRNTGEAGPATQGSYVLSTRGFVVVGDYDVIAFDGKTGAQRWRFMPHDGYGPGLYCCSAIRDLVLAGSPAGRVYAIDVRTGHERWSPLVSADSNSTIFRPAPRENVVAVAYTIFTAPAAGGVAVLDAGSGNILWKAAFPRSAPGAATNWAGGPVFTRDLLIVSSGDGRIYAFDVANGAYRWSIESLPPLTSQSAQADFRPLAISGRVLVAGSLTGEIVGYDTATQAVLWRRQVGEGSSEFDIAAEGETVFVPFFSGRVVALDASSGSERWRLGSAELGFVWPPAVSKTRVYLAGVGSGFFAYDR